MNTSPIGQYPDVERIKDDILKQFNKDLGDVITRAVRNIYDDLVSLQNVERVANLGALPIANLANRGKFILVQGTGGGADGLYINLDTGGGGYAFKPVTVTI